MSLDDIAESVGTVTDEQDDSGGDRVHDESARELDAKDVQDEYDGGWST